MILHLIPGWASTADCWSAVLEHLGEFPVAHHCWSNPVDIPDEDCVLVGWSLGAIRSLEIASNPRVKGLVLLAGTPRFTSDGDHPGTHPRILQRMQAKLADGRDKVMSDFAAGCFHPHGEGTQMDRWLAGTRSFTTEQLEEGLAQLATLDLRETVRRIDIPTLVIHGTGDRIIPHDAGRDLAAALLQGIFVSIDGEGHALPMVAPAMVADQIRGFLNAHFTVQ